MVFYCFYTFHSSRDTNFKNLNNDKSNQILKIYHLFCLCIFLYQEVKLNFNLWPINLTKFSGQLLQLHENVEFSHKIWCYPVTNRKLLKTSES